MKVLIADDEQGIIDLIKHLITVENCEIVGEANDGVEALHKIRECKPDIVITDIMMPLMNGIDLIRNVIAEMPDTQFIVISGYREFEYAKSALQLGVQDYLLKPIKQSELNGILGKLVTSKEQEISLSRDKERQYSKTLEVLRRDYTNKLLHSVSGGIPELPELNGEKIFHFGEGTFQCGVVKATTEEYDFREGSQTLMLIQELSERIKQEMEECCKEFEYVIAKNQVFFLMQYRENCNKDTAKQLEKVETLIRDLNYKFNFLRICMGLSKADGSLYTIREKYKQAACALTYRYERTKEYIFEYDETQTEAVVSKSILSQYLKEYDFSSCVERMDTEKVTDIFRRIWKKYVEPSAGQKIPCGQTYCVLHNFLNEFHNVIALVLGVDLGGFSQYIMIMDIVENCNMQTMYRVLEEYLTSCLEYCWKLIGEKESKPIRMAKEYVNEHYRDNFSLDDIAKYVCLSPNYFSILFKNEVGQGFNNYLQGVRIEKAKTLLKTTQMRVSDVAKEVGYADLKYFTKLFVKSVGVKPTEYRKFYS